MKRFVGFETSTSICKYYQFSGSTKQMWHMSQSIKISMSAFLWISAKYGSETMWREKLQKQWN